MKQGADYWSIYNTSIMVYPSIHKVAKLTVMCFSFWIMWSSGCFDGLWTESLVKMAAKPWQLCEAAGPGSVAQTVDMLEQQFQGGTDLNMLKLILSQLLSLT